MNYLLSNHERAYNLSFQDGLLSVGTLLSGAPYAQRHWELSNRSAEHCLGHRIIAVLQMIPVIGLLFCLIERIAAWFLATAPLAPQQPLPVAGVQKVTLQNARQYDMPGNQPAACTFHAISAMRELSANFDQVFNWVTLRDGANLSAFQRNVILNRGLPLYERAFAENPQIVEGADFDQIRPYFPAGVQLQQPPHNENFQSFDNRLAPVVRHLFAPLPATKMVWIKNGNEESFAVVSRGQRAIIFDSHKNEIIATSNQAAAQNTLREKLLPFSTEQNGLDITPFAYATN
jgi:hypothetical protein